MLHSPVRVPMALKTHHSLLQLEIRSLKAYNCTMTALTDSQVDSQGFSLNLVHDS